MIIVMVTLSCLEKESVQSLITIMIERLKGIDADLKLLRLHETRMWNTKVLFEKGLTHAGGQLLQIKAKSCNIQLTFIVCV